MHSNYIYHFQVSLLELVYVCSFQVYHFMIFLRLSQMSIFIIFISIRIFHYNLIDCEEINFYLLNLKFIFFNCLFLFTIYFIELAIFQIYFNFSFIMTKLGFIIIY